MNLVSLPEDLHKELVESRIRLEMENKRLYEENIKLKKTIEKMCQRVQEINLIHDQGSKMGRYVDGIKQGIFKPRRNNKINEKVILRTILKLKSTDMEIIAEELNTSYATIRRRLIESKLYPINLQDIKEYYLIFHSTDEN